MARVDISNAGVSDIGGALAGGAHFTICVGAIGLAGNSHVGNAKRHLVGTSGVDAGTKKKRKEEKKS